MISQRLPLVLNSFLLVLTLALLVIVYWSGLSDVVRRWESQAEYSHGFLIPIVAAYILWERKTELAQHLGKGSWWGLPICLFSLLMYIAGEVSALFILIHYSFLFLLLGLALLILGNGVKLSLVPIAILAFAIPLPYVIEVILTAKMQLISSALGVEIIRLFDIPVYLSGNVIDLGKFKLQVVEACSGMRYLFPLTCIGFIAAYFYRTAFWKRATVFLSTIPITIAMNSFRIGVVGILVENYGSQAAEGFLHDFQGWLIFLICALILLLEVVVLERFTSNRKLSELFQSTPIVSKENTAIDSATLLRQLHRNSAHLSAVVVLLGASYLSLYFIEDRENAVIEEVLLADFPMSMSEWQGSKGEMKPSVVETLKMTDYLTATYKRSNRSSAPVNLYLAYYANQKKGASPHSPSVCMPGGGWEIAEFSRSDLNGIPVNRALIRKGTQEQLVYYWFVERGSMVANEYWKKWMLFRDAVWLGRSDGSLVRVVTPVIKSEGLKGAEERIANFVAQANPEILRALPSSIAI